MARASDSLQLVFALWCVVQAANGFSLRRPAAGTRIPVPISTNSPVTVSASYSSPLFTTQAPRRRDSLLGISTTPSTSNMDDNNSDEHSSVPSFPLVLWRFTRPHTLIGSALAIPALHVLAAPSFQSLLSKKIWSSIVFCMLPSLLMNLYITGLNQVTDVEIDKINKPYLPIASGELSKRNATLTVVLALVTSLYMGSSGTMSSSGLTTALWGSGILGTMYSLPPFRLKRHPVLAALCIVVVRGTIINAGFFAHAKTAAFGVLGANTSVWHFLLHDRACFLSSFFFGVFGIVIALMKDVPDVKGDAVANVRTFSVRMGQQRIFRVMKNLLIGLFYSFGASFLYHAVVAAPCMLIGVCRSIVGASCVAAGLSVQRKAATVDAEDPQQVYTFYMHLWKLFYLSYLVLPLAR